MTIDFDINLDTAAAPWDVVVKTLQDKFIEPITGTRGWGPRTPEQWCVASSTRCSSTLLRFGPWGTVQGFC